MPGADPLPASAPPGHRALDRIRPLRAGGLESGPVGGELVLIPPGGQADVFALNATGRVIWEHCDGEHTLREILAVLRDRFAGDDLEMLADLTTALHQLGDLGLIDARSLRADPIATDTLAGPAPERRVRFVCGVEDTPYFRWQLAILFESLVGQLPAGWQPSIVVCNNHRPLSDELRHLLETYEVEAFTGDSHPDNHDIDFAGGGDRYVPMNRVEALNVISQHVAPDELVVLMDTDLFLYGDLQPTLFPRGDAMAKNWIIGQDRYFEFATDPSSKVSDGLSLPKLLEALGLEADFRPGGVMVFLTGATLRANDRKVVRDAFRFLQILRLSAQVMELPDRGAWVAEMACYALAMYPSGRPYELLETEQFSVQQQHADELPEGSFYHYYADINDGADGPFFGSQWHKQLFREADFLAADLEGYLACATGEAERRFMQFALRARERLHD